MQVTKIPKMNIELFLDLVYHRITTLDNEAANKHNPVIIELTGNPTISGVYPIAAVRR